MGRAQRGSLVSRWVLLRHAGHEEIEVRQFLGWNVAAQNDLPDFCCSAEHVFGGAVGHQAGAEKGGSNGECRRGYVDVIEEIAVGDSGLDRGFDNRPG